MAAPDFAVENIPTGTGYFIRRAKKGIPSWRLVYAGTSIKACFESGGETSYIGEFDGVDSYIQGEIIELATEQECLDKIDELGLSW